MVLCFFFFFFFFFFTPSKKWGREVPIFVFPPQPTLSLLPFSASLPLHPQAFSQGRLLLLSLACPLSFRPQLPPRLTGSSDQTSSNRSVHGTDEFSRPSQAKRRRRKESFTDDFSAAFFFSSNHAVQAYQDVFRCVFCFRPRVQVQNSDLADGAVNWKIGPLAAE